MSNYDMFKLGEKKGYSVSVLWTVFWMTFPILKVIIITHYSLLITH